MMRSRVTPEGGSISIPRPHPQPESDATLPLGEGSLNAIATTTVITPPKPKGSEDIPPIPSSLPNESTTNPHDSPHESKLSLATPPSTTNEPSHRRNTASVRAWKMIGKVAILAKSLNPREDVIDIYHDPTTNVSHYMIHPNSTFRRLWDLITTAFVMYVCVMVPLVIGFSYVNYGDLKTFDQVIDVYFIIDMFITMRTGIFSNGEVIMDSRVVMRRYLKTWFVIDAISNFPLALFVSSSARKSIKMVKLQKLPKLLRFSRVLKYLREYAKYYNLVLSLIAMGMGLHFFACLWASIFSECYDAKGVAICDSDEMARMYTQSLQNVMLMFLGIAESSSYGSISRLADPRANGADVDFYLMNVVISLIGLIFTSILFGNILSLLMSWDQQKAQFRNRMDIIAAEMRYYELPEELQHRVRRNYDYLWINQRAYSDMMLLNQPGISKTLRMTIALHLYKDLVKTVPFFAGSDARFLGKVCLALETAVYLPGDTIIYYDDIGKEMFIVRKGLVEIILPHQGQTDKRIYLRDGNFFGETALVIDVRRTNTVRAVNICDLNVLSKTSFNEIAAEYPEFGERMKRTVIKRQMDNMNIQSPAEKMKVQSQLTKVVEKSLKARRMSVSLRTIYRAKKLGDKLKEITDRPKNSSGHRIKTIARIAPMLALDPSGRVDGSSRSRGLVPPTRSHSLQRTADQVEGDKPTTPLRYTIAQVAKDCVNTSISAVNSSISTSGGGGGVGNHRLHPTSHASRPFATIVSTHPGHFHIDSISRKLSKSEANMEIPNAIHEINCMVNAIKKTTDRLNRRLQHHYSDVGSSDDDVDDRDRTDYDNTSMANDEPPPIAPFPEEYEQEVARRERRSVYTPDVNADWLTGPTVKGTDKATSPRTSPTSNAL